MTEAEARVLQSLKCDRCNGGMLRCEKIADMRYGNVRGMRMGTEYSFRCVCGATLLHLDRQRWKVTGVRMLFIVPLSLMCGAFGLKILLDTLRHGMGGNDPVAIYVVLAVLFGLGVLGGVGIPLRARRLFRDRRRYELASKNADVA